MTGEMSDDEKATALSELRAIRARHGLTRRAKPAVERVAATELVKAEKSFAQDLDDPMAIKYSLELAAHRETTQRLLAEKDRTIEAQAALIDELRQRQAAEQTET